MGHPGDGKRRQSADDAAPSAKSKLKRSPLLEPIAQVILPDNTSHPFWHTLWFDILHE